MSLKQDALDAISSLPENTEIDDIMYRLYVIDKIRSGQEAIKNEKKYTVEELKKEVETW
jgi:hypothetical protein